MVELTTWATASGEDGDVPNEAPNPGTPHDLLRVSLTLAAIAVALAAFRDDSVVAPFFLAVGLLASAGSVFAMIALWEDAGLGIKHLLTGILSPDRDHRYTALVIIAWSVIALFIVFAVFLFTSTG
ncbi:MAG: hypothetical protein M3464_09465 [Chloroflexota bacterium]|nr:hypothetical protein [Chloroflexota bacterium]